MYEYNGVEIMDMDKQRLLDAFISTYVDADYPSRILFGNHLKSENRRISTTELDQFCIDTKPVVLYHERLKKLYDTNLPSIIEYINQLEPWEDVDLVIFDETLKWYICVTHEDSILVHGL